MVAVAISFILLFLRVWVKDKLFLREWKNSSFECGLGIFSASRQPFSVQFFLVGLLFLLFDVEVSFLVPVIFSLSWGELFSLLLGACVVVLLLGLVFEWEEEKLEWRGLEIF